MTFEAAKVTVFARMKKGRRPIAPPRLVCTLESPVSLRIDLDNWGYNLGPLRVFLSSVRSEMRFGERWRVRSPKML